jgi:hypothetical protein
MKNPLNSTHLTITETQVKNAAVQLSAIPREIELAKSKLEKLNGNFGRLDGERQDLVTMSESLSSSPPPAIGIKYFQQIRALFDKTRKHAILYFHTECWRKTQQQQFRTQRDDWRISKNRT